MARTRLGKMPYVIVFCLVVVLVLLASGLGVVTDMPLKGLDPDDVTSITLSDAMGVNDPVTLEDEDRDSVLAALAELRGGALAPSKSSGTSSSWAVRPST